MGTYILISGQILIDLIILILLVWLIRTSSNRVPAAGLKVPDFQIPETLIKEIEEIAADLDKNLEQKRTLSHDILARLTDRLEQAESYVRRIEKINEAYEHQLKERSADLKDKEQNRSSIRALIAKGFSREEIARHWGISLGEIELLLKLQPGTPDTNKP